MKQKLVTILFFTYSCFGFSQMLVNDPNANAQLAKQIAQGVKTVEQTTKTVNLLKQTKAMYDQVNSALQTFGYISEMSSTTTQILKNSGKFLQEIQSTNMFSNKEMSIISSRFSQSMEQGSTILNVANDLLRGGMFKMNDAERLTLLKQSREDLNEALVDTQIARKKFLRIAERRALNDYFKNTQ
ncbi:hypothetical protein HME9304_01792 [Flagellimonas maritima]|uniref:Conjugal transfer protein TrbJ n=1 Tax=Flagellimonas maritima TaxID=1383885 RepID=A0A2Z4LU13_9FLAO|nr:hypothetical protein [Allomuricauda aurantiaca]AWX44787.1 hypothetical protein HME9304_01792 [Allomuricauda aurantiaca]